MDPAIIARPVLALVIGMLLLGVIIFPMQPKDSAEYYVTGFTIIMNTLFLIYMFNWIRKTGQKKKQEGLSTENPNENKINNKKKGA
ncbi:MAG: hypothetical protein ACLFQV_08655 [Vulcanimicrobiota bacterium]